MNIRSIPLILLALTLSSGEAFAANPVSISVPMESLFYGDASRFSSHQLGTYKKVAQKILSQIGCSSNLDSYRKSGMIDSETFHLEITALCPVSYDLRFQTLTTELVGTFKPDLLFLNGRLVKMGGDSGQISFSDGEIIDSTNVGSGTMGYSSHPSKQPALNHIDNVSDLRATMVRAGFKQGLTAVAVGGSLFTLGASSTVQMSLLRVLSFLGSPESLMSVFHKLLGGTMMSQNILTGAGAATLGAGAFITLVSFPTSVSAGDLDSMYRQPEFQSQLLVSKPYSQLASHFGETSEQVLKAYYQGQNLKSLIKTFANNEKDRQVLIDFYGWWR